MVNSKKIRSVYKGKVYSRIETKGKGKLLYGEISRKGVEQFIKSLPREITSKDTFLDIGSGRGKMVMHMALATPIR